MARVTEAAVLDEAITFFERRGGFNENYYFLGKGKNYYVSEPGEKVVAACAIGGIEQAIWKITGDNVKHDRDTFKGLADENAKTRRLSETQRVYARVMGRLNRLAREKYGSIVDGAVGYDCFIEDLTAATNSHDLNRQRTLDVFRTARAELDQ